MTQPRGAHSGGAAPRDPVLLAEDASRAVPHDPALPGYYHGSMAGRSKGAAAGAPQTSRRDEKTAQIRESVMQAALEVLSEDTFAGARVQTVAARAGVALGTIYNHFENKEDLANEVFRRCKTHSARYCVDPAAGGAPRENFGRWWSTLVNFYSAHPRAFIFLETQDHSRFLDDESRALAVKLDRQVLRDFRAWQASGELRIAEPKLLLAMMVGVFAAIVLETERQGLSLDAAVLELGEDAAWAMLRAPS